MKITEKEKEVLDLILECDDCRERLAEILGCSTASIRNRLKHCRDRNHILETSYLIAQYAKEKGLKENTHYNF